jgi:GNAT superfamily N-acetyltransferase
MTIRLASPDDAAAVMSAWVDSSRTAYAGLMPDDLLARVTSPEAVARRTGILAGHLADERYRAGLLVAVTADLAEAAGTGATAVAGYARFGPERAADSLARPLPAAPAPGEKAELYAIYVRPQMWSTGTGRSLLAEVIDRTTALRYPSLSLWVLEANAKARRFYERAGFAASGERKAEDRFGRVPEVQYARTLG